MDFNELYSTALDILFEQEGITAIYPGGFKPPHRGHFELARAYAEDPNVAVVKILLGPKERQSTDKDIIFTEEGSRRVWENFYMPLLPRGKVVIESGHANPITAGYKYVEEQALEGETIAMIASKKDPGDIKRSTDFAEKHGPEGKYHRPGINVIYYPKSVVVNYEGRDDNLNGYNVSSSVMRDDIAQGHLRNVAAGLPEGARDDVEEIVRILTK